MMNIITFDLTSLSFSQCARQILLFCSPAEKDQPEGNKHIAAKPIE